MDKMRRRVEILKELRSGDSPRKASRRLRSPWAEHGAGLQMPVQSEDPPKPITLDTRRSLVTFVVILAATILLLVIGRLFLK